MSRLLPGRTAYGAVQLYRRAWLWARGLRGGGRTYLRPMPWAAARGESAEGEVVARIAGEQAQPARVSFHGPVAPSPERVLTAAPPLSTATLRRYRDVVLLPRHVMLQRRGSAVLPPSLDLTSVLGVRSLVGNDGGPYVYDLHSRLPQPEVIEDSVFVCDCIFPGFGHTLLEVLPKLDLLRLLPAGTRVATSGMVLPEAFAFLGVAAEQVLKIQGPMFVHEAYTADALVTLAGRFHPAARAAYQRLGAIAARSQIETVPRLFVSRGRTTGRRLRERSQVEGLFREQGFAIVQPELLSFADQVRLFANADMIAGEGGSAMHMLVFARPDARALILAPQRWLSLVDQAVGQRDGQVAFVLGEGVEGPHPRDAEWMISVAAVEAAVENQFGLAPAT